MKKMNLKNLALNKKAISSLNQLEIIKGGTGSFTIDTSYDPCSEYLPSSYDFLLCEAACADHQP
ncbi:hypothetical protein H2O64_23635 [Kordia sp. YSTF-M3]|uniref:Natural product n=1 Tax=Kordia aestuariivivens TaxID=2759037 RepID=A0ABR7QGI3_9FLAO|nr:hypothetical protein [Kordia aestuariivivens]MBC8757681.1 hypothetical protein [Kordia aestuariivivens]